MTDIARKRTYSEITKDTKAKVAGKNAKQKKSLVKNDKIAKEQVKQDDVK